MATFKQFLVEQQVSKQELGRWVYQIAQDCKTAIDQAGGPQAYSLYRGIESSKPFLHKQVREDRRPKDTNQRIHQVMDQWFHDSFGIHYRSNSIACTGDLVSTADYGSLYLVFPIGDFDFIWSPQMADIGTTVEEHTKRTIRTGHGRLLMNVPDHVVEDATERILEEATFLENRLPQAIQSGNEIMVHTKEYYAVFGDYKYQFRRQLMQAYQELYG